LVGLVREIDFAGEPVSLVYRPEVMNVVHYLVGQHDIERRAECADELM